MDEKEISHRELHEKTLGMLLKWRDEMKQSISINAISEMLFTEVEKNPEMARLCFDMKAQAESNLARLDKIIIGYNAPKNEQRP